MIMGVSEESNRSIYLLLLVSLLLKIVLSVLLPLFPDEAYYWVWSRHLDFSYFDHPPMLAWVFSLSDFLPHNWVRVPIVVIVHLKYIFLFYFFKNLNFKESDIFWFFLLLLVFPLTGISSILGLPDSPLLLFWSIALWAFERILNKGFWFYYFAFGLALGLGFISKYHMVLFGIPTIGFLFYQRAFLKLRAANVVLAVLAFFAAISPVLFWNMQHDWASIRFQLQRGLNQPSLVLTDRLYYFFEYLLGQLVLVFPPFLYVFFKGIKNNQIKTERVFLLTLFSLAPLLFFALTSLRGKVEANWTNTAFLCFFALVIFYQKKRNLVLVFLGFWGTLLTWIFLQAFGVMQIKIGKLEDLSLHRPYVKLCNIEEPLFFSRYQEAAIMWYHCNRPVYKLYQVGRFDQFDLWSNSKPPAAEKKQDFIFVKSPANFIPEYVSKTHSCNLEESLGDSEVYRCKAL